MAERFFLFLQAQCDNETGHNWFCIGDHNQSGETLWPIHSMNHNFPVMTLSTGLGHRIYVMGGSCANPNNPQPTCSEFWYTGVYLNNTRGFFGCGWRQGPDMSIPRSQFYGGSVTGFPHDIGIDSAIGLPHTIVVFRGTRNNQLPWAEYFDSHMQSWSALPPPPTEIWRLNSPNEVRDVFNGPSSAFDSVERRIFLHPRSPRVIFTFDIRPQPHPLFNLYDFERDPNDRWTLVNEDRLRSSGKIVISGSCLFVLRERGGIRRSRYNLEGCYIGPEFRGQNIELVLIPFENNVLPWTSEVQIKNMHFVSLDNNGKVCVLWALPDETFGVLCVRCVILTIQVNANANGQPFFVAQLYSDRVFNLDTGEELVNCVVIEPCRGAPEDSRDEL